MKRRRFLQLLATPALVSIARPAIGQTKRKVSFAYLLDPAYDTVVYALNAGKVKSDLIEVEAVGLSIPALIQATATKQFDVVQTSLVVIPSALARGLNLKILSVSIQANAGGRGAGLWVTQDSPITRPEELRSKTLGTYALRGSGFLTQRVMLNKRFGLNMALEGGDIRIVEVSAQNIPGALATKQVDAGTLIHISAYQAEISGEFRSIAELNSIYAASYGLPIGAVNVAFTDRLAQAPEAFEEFNRLFKLSADYAQQNRNEVFAAVARTSNVDPAFFAWWHDKAQTVPAIVSADHRRQIDLMWKFSREFGLSSSVPAVDQVVWDRAPTS